MSTNPIYVMGWDEVLARVARIIPGNSCKVYGIPRGGAVVAGLMKAMNPDIVITETPERAVLVVDDIIDSGATLERFKFHAKDFAALVDKRNAADRSLGWVRFPWEDSDQTKDIADTVVRQLQLIGEDPNRPGLRDTPKRYLKALSELASGVHMDPTEPLKKVFDETHDEIVAVRKIPFVSMCEHHLLPFVGTVDFAYLPSGQVVGLSKIPRFIRILASRPQVQERLTTQIADIFMAQLKPQGVMVVVRGEHSCMRLRGAKCEGSMVTSAVRGVFKDKAEARQETLELFRG